MIYAKECVGSNPSKLSTRSIIGKWFENTVNGIRQTHKKNIFLNLKFLFKFVYLRALSMLASPVSSIPPDPHEDKLAESNDKAFPGIRSVCK